MKGRVEGMPEGRGGRGESGRKALWAALIGLTAPGTGIYEP